MDLGLRELPRAARTFALGIDTPLYMSLHSRWADLAPERTALVHVAKYLPIAASGQHDQDRVELEELMDLVQPGWRGQIMHERFLPRLTVTYALVRAHDGGLVGRPAVDAPAIENVYITGDWVGHEGMLVDAAFASAYRAARLIIGNRQRALHAEAV